MTLRSSLVFHPFVGLALIAGLFLLVSACDSGGGDNAPPTFAVEGRLMNATDRGVRNAQVEFHRDGTMEAETTTDDAGEYAVTLPEGEYDVRVMATGYTSLEYTTSITNNVTTDPRAISDDGGDTLGYYQANSSGDVGAFQTTDAAKQPLLSASFDEAVQ